VIDGTDVLVSGAEFKGYLVYIENSTNITLRNFDRASNFYYVVRAKNSSGITIADNDFSYNKKDTVGWIFIWTGVDQALGGGVLFDRCTDSEIYGNLMTQQNDGVALYGSRNIHIHDNTLNWNCGFGVRMNFTDNCHVHHNDCSHVNRLTDPSDCAAILLIVSNNNVVEYNDLSYSGDGVFLGQYEYSDIPNNNYFAYNECSYSPHNAIEATFADGNVYYKNICNYSHYGFWLGYSFNSVVEDNEINYNLQSGIAVDRGFENTFINNRIIGNPIGIELWEGGVINPYGDQFSHDYDIRDNVIRGNSYGIKAINTEHMVVKDNEFAWNWEDIYIEGEAHDDTITGNTFRSPTWYFIENRSGRQVYAPDNAFVPNDEFRIRQKMSGEVFYQPIREGDPAMYMTTPPCDLAEPDANWQLYAEAYWGYRKIETLTWDEVDKKVGRASLKLVTDRGFDVALAYRPPGDTTAIWSISEDDTLFVWIKTIKNPSYGFQFFHIRIGSYTQAYYKYTVDATQLNSAHNRWRQLKIPVKGNASFRRTEEGAVNLDEISYVEFHADTWDSGFTLWIDGLQFSQCDPLAGINDHQLTEFNDLQIFPNPARDEVTLSYTLSQHSDVTIRILNLAGREVMKCTAGHLPAGEHMAKIQTSQLAEGSYFLVLTAGIEIRRGKLVVIR